MNTLIIGLPTHYSTQMLPSQKQVEIAAFLGPTREEKIYELVARICGQITKAHDYDYKYQHYFIIIDKHLQEQFEEGVNCYSDIINAPIEYVSSVSQLAERVNSIFNKVGSFTIFKGNFEESQQVEEIKTELLNYGYQFCGFTYIPLEQDEEDEVNELDKQINKEVEKVIQQISDT